MNDGYYITYKNEGRSEKTGFMTKEQAERSADFLKFQGAKSVHIHWPYSQAVLRANGKDGD